MTFDLRRAIACVVAASLVAFAAMTGSAHADGDKFGCEVSGNAKFTPPAKFVGGKGTYTIPSLFLICWELEKGTSPAIFTMTIKSNGWYKEHVCGVGKLTADETDLVSWTRIEGNPKVDFETVVDLMKYQVEYVAGVGVWYWHNPYLSKLEVFEAPKLVPEPDIEDKDSPPGKASSSGGNPGGALNLFPSPTKGAVPNPATDCYKELTLVGSVLVDTEGF